MAATTANHLPHHVIGRKHIVKAHRLLEGRRVGVHDFHRGHACCSQHSQGAVGVLAFRQNHAINVVGQ